MVDYIVGLSVLIVFMIVAMACNCYCIWRTLWKKNESEDHHNIPVGDVAIDINVPTNEDIKENNREKSQEFTRIADRIESERTDSSNDEVEIELEIITVKAKPITMKHDTVLTSTRVIDQLPNFSDTTIDTFP